MNSAKIALFFVAIAGFGGCGGGAPKAADSSPAPAPEPNVYVAPEGVQGIATLKVEPRQIPDYLEAPGRVTPDPTRVVHVFPAAGGRVTEMRVRPWDRVTRGQTLAILESADASRAMTDYQKALTDAELKRKTLDRSADLFAHHAVSQKDLEQAQADARSADAEVKTALDALHLLGIDPAAGSNQLQVLAPRSGVVLEIGAAPGELSKSVDAPQPLCTIADLDTVWIEGSIFEKDVKGLKPGAAAQVTLSAYPGEKWAGRVAALGDAVDPATRTLTLRVELPNPQLRLKPDMFATIRLLRSSKSGLVVPAAAVDRQGLKNYVYVGAGDNRFERREVTLGSSADDGVEIVSGLNAGATIVSEGALLLRATGQN